MILIKAATLFLCLLVALFVTSLVGFLLLVCLAAALCAGVMALIALVLFAAGWVACDELITELGMFEEP